jgi:hypothetical protein
MFIANSTDAGNPNFSGRPMACAKLLGLTLPRRGALRFGNGIGARQHPAALGRWKRGCISKV